ncbi:MAG TPA: hypothetical protein VLH58_11605 [Candidatus Methylomirabilis sp.]|nr:hypothetical protein [Candidatus Methylomirabilis sp.]HSC71994.1 hypothetical protein [Candidatus Methylomirabilis sp.]
MEQVVCHFLDSDTDGKPAVYEEDYLRYPIREGVVCHAKVYNSVRPCRCPERESFEKRFVASIGSR